MSPYVFISYQNKDKLVAGELQATLSEHEIRSFLAHEDISVSEEWRTHLIDELRKTDVFICLLSEKYFESVWCSQEAGIAASRPNTTIIPLSLDGMIPQGFISHIQSTKVDPSNIEIRNLLPGFIKHNFDFAVSLITQIISKSSSFSGAESNFELIMPHIPKMSDNQVKALLEFSAQNRQVFGAKQCAGKFLPPLLMTHGKLIKPGAYQILEQACI